MTKSFTRTYTHLVHIGVDPGAKGAIAVLYPDSSASLWTMHPTYPDEEAIWNQVSDIIDKVKHLRYQVTIEHVTGYIGNSHPGSAMFEFGRGYGALRTAFFAATGRFPETIRPREWQKAIGISPRRKGFPDKKSGSGETKSDFKRRIKKIAQKLFPHLHITLETCDALLIAEAMRRKERL